ncbi:MAG: NAD-glutamate dehydrogenase [Desulforhopalus sp.]|nr:NAD-glutamate dehydrogenase [Desulforhopalus sp.]
MIVDDHGQILAQVEKSVFSTQARLVANLAWLKASMHPYFFFCNSEDIEEVAVLASDLHLLEHNRRFILADNEKNVSIAQLGVPGALYAALRSLPEKPIAYAQLHTSYAPVPNTAFPLEVLEFDFNCQSDEGQALTADQAAVPGEVVEAVQARIAAKYNDFPAGEALPLLDLLWQNNKKYVRTSPIQRIARLLWLFGQCRFLGGVFLDVEEGSGVAGVPESRVMFGVANPPERGFLLQILEVFRRLDLKVHRAYCLTLHEGEQPFFLATFYVSTSEGALISRDSQLFAFLRAEMYTTLLMPMTSLSYEKFVAGGIAGGPDATLVHAFIGFCHTNLAHAHPDSFDLEGVSRAFHNHPELTLQLVRLFHARFSPEARQLGLDYQQVRLETADMVENFTTGRRFLDQFRRTIFRCCLLFVNHTLKTNFFIAEKRALAFRLDPAYLAGLEGDFTRDLPADRPFRISYFSCRSGAAYHIGFSDIARGGWRTVITQGRDDYVTAANNLFKETYVLAHTQHLKNKDIYEGGSKMVAVLRAEEGGDSGRMRRQLHLLQYALLSGFLDLFVTKDGRASDPRIVDYYREEEPIELGPDENMHDSMIELVAREAVRRGYVLGPGIMSSKKVGINHKDYGVTSNGVIRFAEVCLATLGIDMARDPFRVIFTGGPNGDVAGNCLAILLERCAKVAIPLILDGSAALVDPQGIDHDALREIILKDDVRAFNPQALHPGGYLLYRTVTRRQGMQELFKKVTRTADGLVEEWVSNDEFYKEYNALIFTVPADLFIPAGGRPETVDAGNWRGFFTEDGEPTCRVIVEGANSFITPEARAALQKGGIILMRDASANKCGVISSSYEIIANLLLSEEEFLAHKPEYVADVLQILQKRAEEEAKVIFRRHREAAGELLYTDISNDVSREINDCYARLFSYFQGHPEVCDQPLYHQAILDHLPRMLTRDGSPFSNRIGRLPEKIKFAILASEISSSMVYHGNRDDAFLEAVNGHLQRRAMVKGRDDGRS